MCLHLPRRIENCALFWRNDDSVCAVNFCTSLLFAVGGTDVAAALVWATGDDAWAAGPAVGLFSCRLGAGLLAGLVLFVKDGADPTRREESKVSCCTVLLKAESCCVTALSCRCRSTVVDTFVLEEASSSCISCCENIERSRRDEEGQGSPLSEALFASRDARAVSRLILAVLPMATTAWLTRTELRAKPMLMPTKNSAAPDARVISAGRDWSRCCQCGLEASENVFFLWLFLSRIGGCGQSERDHRSSSGRG